MASDKDREEARREADEYFSTEPRYKDAFIARLERLIARIRAEAKAEALTELHAETMNGGASCHFCANRIKAEALREAAEKAKREIMLHLNIAGDVYMLEREGKLNGTLIRSDAARKERERCAAEISGYRLVIKYAIYKDSEDGYTMHPDIVERLSATLTPESDPCPDEGCPRDGSTHPGCTASEQKCAWTYDGDTNWNSACGRKWFFDDGGPNENGVKFCHGCGKPVCVVENASEKED